MYINALINVSTVKRHYNKLNLVRRKLADGISVTETVIFVHSVCTVRDLFGCQSVFEEE